MDAKLTIKQELFCKYYIENKGNASKAYMKAFSTKKEETAKANASRLLTNANISQKIRMIMQQE
jgi:phage terminase small subunit